MHNAIINDIKHYSLPSQLEYADNISMYYSLEARSLLFYQEILIKLSNSFPDTFFLRMASQKQF